MLFSKNNTNKGLTEYESTPGAVLVDVREAKEYASGYIPGAVNMPLSLMQLTTLPKDRPLFLYCLRGARSRNDNAPVLQMETEEKYFSFIVRTDFSGSCHRFDQCGIVMYLDSENWLKGSVEYENESFQHLGSVVTNHGFSDWATTEIPANVKDMWYRFSRREDDYCIECSTDGEHFSQMRVCHMWEGSGKICFGVYACSPENSSFKAVFTDMQITECAWKPHDGQKPDE